MLYVLIPLLPLTAFVVIALLARRLSANSHRIGIPAVLLACALSVVAFVDVLRGGAVDVTVAPWFRSGGLTIELGLYIDALTAVMLLLVTGVSGIVHLFSARYMQGDPRYARFFAVIALFTGAMLALVMSKSLLLLFLCWEVMGLCSYLLISHWAMRWPACEAATKAFLVNACADLGLSLGLLLTVVTFGTLDIQQVLAQAPSHVGQTLNLLGWAGLDGRVEVITLIAVLLFIGAMGKSAQVPFHVWLPFAMEAPTPVSALIHAATMVNAGVFLVVRLSPLFSLSAHAMTLIVMVGGVTALFAAAVALTQSDIKRILAYSTISQIGFMMLACGVGAYVAAIFHLLAHGALKAYLFLSAGSVLQTMALREGSRDPAHVSPARLTSRWPVYAGALVLAWLPPVLLFSGPYERLWSSRSNAAPIVFWTVGLATALLTAVYLVRSLSTGACQALPIEWREASAGLPKPGLSLLWLIGLATCGLAGFTTLIWYWFAGFLSPAVTSAAVSPAGQEASGVVRFLALLIPVAVASVGWGAAYLSQTQPMAGPRWWAEASKTLYVAALNRGYLDELYEALIVQPTVRLARWLWRTVDVEWIDQAIHRAAWQQATLASWLWQAIDLGAVDRLAGALARLNIRLAGWLWRSVDVGGVDRAVSGLARQNVTFADWLWRSVDVGGVDRVVDEMAGQAANSGQVLRHVEPRMLQHHVLVMITCLVLVMSLFLWFIR